MTGVPQRMASTITSPKGSGQSIGNNIAPRVAEEVSFLPLRNLTDEMHLRMAQERLDHVFKVPALRRIHLGRDPQRQTRARGDLDRKIGPLFRGDPS